MKNEDPTLRKPKHIERVSQLYTLCPREHAWQFREKNFNGINFKKWETTCGFIPTTSHLESLAPYRIFPPPAFEDTSFQGRIFEPVKWNDDYIVHPDQYRNEAERRIVRIELYYLENLSYCRELNDRLAAHIQGLSDVHQPLTHQILVDHTKKLSRAEQNMLVSDRECKREFTRAYLYGPPPGFECICHNCGDNPFKVASVYVASPLSTMHEMAVFGIHGAIFIAGNNGKPNKIVVREENQFSDEALLRNNSKKLNPNMERFIDRLSHVLPEYYGKWIYDVFNIQQEAFLSIGHILQQGDKKKFWVFSIRYDNLLDNELRDYLTFDGLTIEEAI